MKLAVSSWSFRDRINKEFPLGQFGAFIKKRYDIDAVELCQVHFLSQDSKYLDELVSNLNEAGVTIVNIPIDTGNISQLDPRKRNHDLKVIKTWMDVAKYVGALNVRVNTGSQDGDVADLSITVDSYRELAEYGDKIGVGILLENHGGISSDPEMIRQIFERVKHSNFRACPDFGNFMPNLRYMGIDIMAKYAAVAHVKPYSSYPPGQITEVDIPRCLQVLRENGFDGYLSVEFGRGGDPDECVEKTIDVIRKTWQ